MFMTPGGARAMIVGVSSANPNGQSPRDFSGGVNSAEA